MKAITNNIFNNFAFLAVIAGITAIMSACNPANSQKLKVIKIDGSSSVYPITQEAGNDFNLTKASVKESQASIKIDVSGTTGGFKKFCTGETDINNASRPIHDHEMRACAQGGVGYVELPIGFDAVTFVVNSQNSWAHNITMSELKKIWEPAAKGKITKWSQIRADWPDKPLRLYGPSRESGTFDYFTEIGVGKEGAIRSDYTANQDYNILAQKVSQDPNALAFFAYAYYKSNKNNLKALALDTGAGNVLPSHQTVKWGKYKLFSRPLFIYVNSKSAQQKPELKEFVEFYLNKAPEFVSAVGYVPLTDDNYRLNQIHFQKGKVGTVFGGKSQFNLSMEELLRKEAMF